MNIAIDAREWKDGGAGKSRYVSEVIRHLIKFDKKNNYYLLINNQTIKTQLPSNFKTIILPKWPYFWLGAWQKSAKIDLFFSPTSYLMTIFSKVKTITVVHDLAVFLEKRSRPSLKTKLIERLTLKLALKKSSQVIVVSNNTKQDILKNYKINADKITTIYLAPVSTKEAQVKDVLAKYNIAKPYILYVGTIEPRKNVESIIKAFALTDENIRNNYRLVLAGKRGWNIEYIDKIIDKENLNTSVIQTGFVADEDLPEIYSKASLFVYPSWYEGFGLPVLEAMKFGVPVITSNTSSLPEVAGTAARLVKPDDIKQLSKDIATILLDKKVSQEMVRQGLVQASSFSWDKAVSELLDEFIKIGGNE